MAAAVGLGLVMRVLAGLAGHGHAGDLVLDVVNWGALWLVVPVVAGRGAGDAIRAATIGAVSATLQVATFYGSEAFDAPFKIAWLAGGAVAGALLATVAQRTRARSWSSFLVPALFVLEPAAVFAAFHHLQRSPWSSWDESAVAEVCVGAGIAAAVALAGALRPIRRAAPARSGCRRGRPARPPAASRSPGAR